MISLILVYVPLTRPTTAAIVIKEFLATMKALSNPLVVFQYTQVWINAGNAKPNALRQRAPKSEMNNSKFGIAMASRTVNEDQGVN